MKISYYIFLSFVSILALFALTTYINFKLSKDITEDSEYFTRSTEIIRKSNRFQRNMLNMVSGLRGYLITGENSFVESYGMAGKENDSILQELSPMLTDSSQVQLLAEIKQLNDRWTDAYTEPLRQAKLLSANSRASLDSFNKIYKEKIATGAEKEMQSTLQDKFRQFSAYEYNIRNTRKNELTRTVNKTRRLSFLFTGISVIAACAVVFFLVRKISGRINRMVGMANTIASGKYDTNIEAVGNDELSELARSLNHMAAELSKNISLLQQSNAELDQFAHIVSHDMKSPLRGIANVVNWIEEDHEQELGTKLREYLELIKGRITRAENLIEGLLAYARIDKEHFEQEDVNVNELVNEILENNTDKNIEAVATQLPVVHTERVLLFQVFSNIISNAVKYNDKEVLLLHISSRDHTDRYEFHISDNGMGIPEKHYKRIFTIFQTLKEKDSLESTGVGLAIVKKILDSKGQTIKVRSEEGKGSVFSFTWPKA